MSKITIHWFELLENLMVIFGIIYIAGSAYQKGYEKRSKELETDFDFNKKPNL
jgi:hypothetical protein